MNKVHGFDLALVMDKLTALAAEQKDQLSSEQIMEAFPDVAPSDTVLDAVMERLEESGITILSRETDLYPDQIQEDEEEEADDDLLFASGKGSNAYVNGTQVYMNNIAKYPLMDTEEMYTLACRAKAGDAAARNEFVCRNLRLVVSIAKHFTHRGVELDDLIQYGNLGLMHALDKFEPDKMLQFSTYASWWIRSAIQRGISEANHTVSISHDMDEKITKYKNIQRDLTLELGSTPTVKQIAKEYARWKHLRRYQKEPSEQMLDYLVTRKSLRDDIALILIHMQDCRSLDVKVGNDGDDSLMDFICDDKAQDPYKIAEKNDLARNMAYVLGELPEREASVLCRRYIDRWTLDECAREYGVTRERIRQIEAKALRKIRNTPSYSELLRSYYQK